VRAVINNSWACQNSQLLNKILKTELAFEGYVSAFAIYSPLCRRVTEATGGQVQTDWGAQHSGVSAANAGLDMSMPGEAIPRARILAIELTLTVRPRSQATSFWAPTRPTGDSTSRKLVCCIGLADETVFCV
jgi:beta-glucosidase-like glycosyl hydrolase